MAPAGQNPEALQILDVSTGATRLLTGAEAGWAWSPDGKQIFYRVSNAQQGDEFYVANVETGQTREVAIPHGKLVAFLWARAV